MNTVIQRVCQYCFADMGTKDGRGMTGVSHGICNDCAELPEEQQMAVYQDALKQRAVNPR